MQPWPDEKIAVIASRLIRRCSREPDTWRHTVLERWDERIPLAVDRHELPLVVIYFSPSSWTVFTSRRIAGVFGSQSFDVSPLDVKADRWGMDPKGIGGSVSRTASLELSRNHRKTRLLMTPPDPRASVDDPWSGGSNLWFPTQRACNLQKGSNRWIRAEF